MPNILNIIKALNGTMQCGCTEPNQICNMCYVTKWKEIKENQMTVAEPKIQPCNHVTYTNPKGGGLIWQVVAQEHLVQNSVYEVEKIVTNTWNTDIFLTAFPGIAFNRASFTKACSICECDIPLTQTTCIQCEEIDAPTIAWIH